MAGCQVVIERARRRKGWSIRAAAGAGHARAVRLGDPGCPGGRTEALEQLAVELYARGLSTRDIEDAFIDEDGRRLLSRAAVSETTERLWTEHEGFSRRDLSEHEIVYRFVDGIAPGINRAIEECFPRSPRQRCAHRMRNVPGRARRPVARVQGARAADPSRAPWPPFVAGGARFLIRFLYVGLLLPIAF